MYILLMPDCYRSFQSFEDGVIQKVIRSVPLDRRDHIRIVHIRHTHNYQGEHTLILYSDGSYFLSCDGKEMSSKDGEIFLIDSSDILTSWQYNIHENYGVVTDDGKEGKIFSRHFFPNYGLQYRVWVESEGHTMLYPAERLFPITKRKTSEKISDEVMAVIVRDAVRLWLA